MHEPLNLPNVYKHDNPVRKYRIPTDNTRAHAFWCIDVCSNRQDLFLLTTHIEAVEKKSITFRIYLNDGTTIYKVKRHALRRHLKVTIQSISENQNKRNVLYGTK